MKMQMSPLSGVCIADVRFQGCVAVALDESSYGWLKWLLMIKMVVLYTVAANVFMVNLVVTLPFCDK